MTTTSMPLASLKWETSGPDAAKFGEMLVRTSAAAAAQEAKNSRRQIMNRLIMAARIGNGRRCAGSIWADSMEMKSLSGPADH
jgi:hypothetical protein